MDYIEHLFDDIDEFLNVPPYLDLNMRAFLDVIYGPPVSLPVAGELPHVRGLDETLASAQTFLERQREKGFIRDSDLSRVTNPYFRKRLLKKPSVDRGAQASQKADAPQKKTDLETLFESEPYQVYWFNSHVVRRTTSELKSLPYLAESDMPVAINELQDKVASVCRVLHHKGRLDIRKQTEVQLRKVTKDFIEAVYEIRRNLIKKLIIEKKLDLPKLKPEHQQEFAAEITAIQEANRPAVAASTAAATYDANPRTFEKFAHKLSGFPTVYRTSLFPEPPHPLKSLTGPFQGRLLNLMAVSDDHFPGSRRLSPSAAAQGDGDSRGRQVQIIGQRDFSPESEPEEAISAPAEATLTSKETHHRYWDAEDPLARERQGAFHDVLGSIEEIGRNITYPDHTEDLESIEMPFELEVIKREELEKARLLESETLKGEVWNTADLQETSEPESPRSEVEEGATDTRILDGAMPVSSYSTADHAANMRFLMKQNMKMKPSQPMDGVPGAETIHQKLEAVWQALGFSIQQKLVLLLKYSENVEESGKLSNALRFWDQALQLADNFRTSYRAYKEAIALEGRGGGNSRLLDECEKQMKIAEDALLRIAGTLKNAFGDDLIIKRRRVTDFIAEKHQNIAMLRGR
jgi:hypothetical protein